MLQPYTLSSDLFDRLPSLLYRATLDGRFVQVNHALLQMSRYPNLGALLSCGPADTCVDPKDRDQWLAMITEAIPCNDFEFQFRCYDGTILWLRNNSYAVHDERGEMLYYEGSFEDITPRKQAESALLEHQARLEHLLAEILEIDSLLAA